MERDPSELRSDALVRTGACAAVDKDHFFVTKIMHSYFSWHAGGTVSADFGRTFAQPWPYDHASIKCKTFVYNGENEQIKRAWAEQHTRAIPRSKLILFPEHGHATIMMEIPRILAALVRGQSCKSRYA